VYSSVASRVFVMLSHGCISSDTSCAVFNDKSRLFKVPIHRVLFIMISHGCLQF
jgi:hypothetical protein